MFEIRAVETPSVTLKESWSCIMQRLYLNIQLGYEIYKLEYKMDAEIGTVVQVLSLTTGERLPIAGISPEVYILAQYAPVSPSR
jgi:hypothetical protein